MPVKLDLMIDGRKVTQDEFLQSVQQNALELGERHLADLLSHVRCPVHGQPASGVQARPTDDGARELVFVPCCEALRDAVQQVLMAELREDDEETRGLGD